MNLEGTWQSNLGLVTLHVRSPAGEGMSPVSGSWVRKDGRKGIIADTNKRFGETSVQPLTVPTGTTEAASANNWQVTGAGGCVSFYARALLQNPDKSRVSFTSTDGSVVSHGFQVCPSQ